MGISKPESHIIIVIGTFILLFSVSYVAKQRLLRKQMEYSPKLYPCNICDSSAFDDV